MSPDILLKGVSNSDYLSPLPYPTKTMIDLILYRIRIGRSFIKYKSLKGSKIKIRRLLLIDIVKFGFHLFLSLLKLYLIVIFSCGFLLKDFYKTPASTLYIDGKSKFIALSFITIKYINFYSRTPDYLLNDITNVSGVITLPNINDKVLKIILHLNMVSLLNFLAFAIINPSMKNSGPRSKNLSIMYQNVQGLIPFAYLGDNNPVLDNTKLFELQANIYFHKPDIVVINETWLKDSIIDNEIFLSQHYKIFRCDRTVDTHPPDPSNPKKFRKNGGGVLIVLIVEPYKADIAYEVKRVKVECKAELLAIEIITENKSKVIIATCYRVGTLCQDNCFEITNTICKLLRKKNLKKFFMIGDFNLPGIQWENGTNFNEKVTDPIKTSFVNSFAENGLEQCIYEPTHRAGNVLDLLLTTSSNSISNLKINDIPLCKSDHFSINFEVDLKVKRRKSIKRKCFNFKKANWDNLNNELAKINWFNLLDSINPNDSWNTFVNLLHHNLNKNIPTITTKG